MSAPQERITFLSRLPEAAHVNILRFLTEARNEFVWRRSLSLDTIADLTHESHPLRSAAIGVIKSLPHSFPFQRDKRELSERIFRVFGPGLTSLTLECRVITGEEATLSLHCTRLGSQYR